MLDALALDRALGRLFDQLPDRVTRLLILCAPALGAEARHAAHRRFAGAALDLSIVDGLDGLVVLSDTGLSFHNDSAPQEQAPAFDACALLLTGVRPAPNVSELEGIHALLSPRSPSSPATAAAPRGRLVILSEHAPGSRSAVLVPAESSTAPAFECPVFEEVVANLLTARFSVRETLDANNQPVPWSRPNAPGTPGIETLKEHPEPLSAPYLLVAEPMEFSIRSYRAGDEQGILDLFHRCFSPERDLDHWRWKFAENPDARLRISLACAPTGRIVAHYSAYGTPWWDAAQGRGLRAQQIGDIMSAPEIRHVGRGRTSLFALTARHFYAAHCHGKVDFNYGVHTQASRGFSSRFLEVRDIEPVTQWRRDQRVPLDEGGYRTELFAAPAAAHDRLWLRARGAYGRLAVRDRRRLSWRYFNRPDGAYVMVGARRWGRLVGWSVFARRGTTLSWGDALFLPDHARAAQSVLARAVIAFREEGTIDEIVAWFPQRPRWWHDELERLGFVPADEPQGLRLAAAFFHQPTDPLAFGRELYYTKGDFDLF